MKRQLKLYEQNNMKLDALRPSNTQNIYSYSNSNNKRKRLQTVCNNTQSDKTIRIGMIRVANIVTELQTWKIRM